MIGITMGDASGVGPEIILKSYYLNRIDRNYVVFGDIEIFKKCADLLKIPVSLKKINSLNDVDKDFLNIYDLGLLSANDLRIGEISKKSGFAALKYVEIATQLALQKKIKAIVTLPMNKEATRLSTPNFTGHTEFIAGLCGETNYTMMLASDKMLVTHISTHVSIAKAVEQVKKDRILNVIELTAKSTQKLRRHSRIAVAGLNPHAGESGAFGIEEVNEIAPAVQQAKASGYDVSGPIAPDTIFLKAMNKEFEAVVCMYHDQGHIPMKLLDFDNAVNTTLGLPIVRTSVDHGTAFDIAYTGKASTGSFINACDVAEQLADF
jgi:4-phospho-D-threonate 3-dehydrogenase / 4-phospho-D-erythronate 3-dehydrogenase